jgi:hypothetical protein
LGQISDDYGFSKLQIVYYPKGKLEFVKRGVIPIKLMVMISFIFFQVGWLLNKGFPMSIILRSLTMMHEMVSKAQRRVFSNRIVTDEEKKG